jgi:hypothetical protein
METTCAIINESQGWLENLVVWDGKLETWKPPAGTYAVPLAEIDLTTLPPSPEV